MSRSFRKTPGWTCGSKGRKKSSVPYTKFAKRQAARRVRHSTICANGGWFKKVYCSWDIQDYKKLYFEFSNFPALKEYLIENDQFPFNPDYKGNRMPMREAMSYFYNMVGK